MRSQIMLLLCCMVSLAGACTTNSIMLDETKLVASIESEQDVMYNPVSLSTAKEALPFSFQTPSFLPYSSQSNIQAVIRRMKQHLILQIKYPETEAEKRGYVELTVANFPYNMDLIEQQQLFDEQVLLDDGIKAYFKSEKIESSMTSLTWKKHDIDYQLIYRYSDGIEQEEIKAVLLQVANSMGNT